MNQERPTLTNFQLPLGEIGGIVIALHWTFLVFAVWIAIDAFTTEIDPLIEIVTLFFTFFSVLLHELGHAFVAGLYKVQTRSIVLYPIGGIARLTGRVKPWGELWIAAGGPFVNLLITLSLMPFASSTLVAGKGDPTTMLASLTLLDRALLINMSLFLFNLLPAFPMDGGRILRAILSLILDEERGTLYATRIGQVLGALMFFGAILLPAPILAIVGALVFMTASREHFLAQTKRVVRGRKIREVMVEVAHLLTFQHGTPITTATEQAVKSLQDHFPVLLGDAMATNEVLGVVAKEDLFRAIATGERDQYVAGIMEREFTKASPDNDLVEFVERGALTKHTPIIVLEDGRLVGMVPADVVYEFVLIFGPTLRSEQARGKEAKANSSR
jgi:Zn-dependent protease